MNRIQSNNTRLINRIVLIFFVVVNFVWLVFAFLNGWAEVAG